MQKYKLTYKDTPDWELTLPIFINPEDKEIVDSFFLNKGIKTVEYAYTAFGAYSVAKVPNCSIVRTFDGMIITRYKQIAEICKITN